MTFEEVKKWLNRAYKIDELIKLDKKKIEEWEELATTLGGQDFDERVQSSRKLEAAFVKNLEKKDAAIKKYNHRIVERYNLKEEIDEVINSLQDNEIITILDYRYLQFLKFREIASITYLGLATVHRLHNKGLLEVKNILEQMEQGDML